VSIAPKDSDGPAANTRTARLGQVWEVSNGLAVAQTPSQVSGSTTRSDIDSIDHSSLSASHNHRLTDPGIAATAPLHLRIRSRLVARLCLVAAILISATGIIMTFRQFPLAHIWRDHISSWTQLSTMESQRAIARLRVESSRGMLGEPIRLGLAIDGPAEGLVLTITGMLAGMDISTGNEVSPDSWQLLPEDVPYAFVAPPEKFVGFVGLIAELRLANDMVVDRQAIYLEWAAPSPLSTAEDRHNREGPNPPVESHSNGEKAATPASARQEAMPSSTSAVESDPAERISAKSSLTSPAEEEQQETRASSSPRVEANSDQEKSEASSPPSASNQVDRQGPDSRTMPITSDPDRENKAAMPHLPPRVAEEVVRQELLSSATSPVEIDPETRKVAEISNSALPKPEEQQTIASSSPPGENDPNREATAVSSSVLSEPNRVDRQEVTSLSTTPVAIDQHREKGSETSNSPALAVDGVVGQELPLTASEPGREKTAAISSSTPPALGHQAVTASSSASVANDPDIKKSSMVQSSPSLTQNQGGREEVGPPGSSTNAQKQVDQNQLATESGLLISTQRRRDPEDIAVLLKRGKDLIAHGDIAAARVTLKRAAEANHAEAALALASTYDPIVLRELKVYGFPADAAMARAWYEKAKELGSAVAPRRLEMLARETR
jgi:hypothetical protein